MLDEKQNLGTMAQTGGALYDQNVESFEISGRDLGSFMENFSSQLEVSAWEGDTQIQQNGEVPQLSNAQIALNAGAPNLQELEDPKWADYSQNYYHPRSILIPTQELHSVQSIVVKQHQEEEETACLSFNNWLLAKNLWATTSFRDEMEDRIRLYSEECDWLDGFKFLADSPQIGSGFGYLAPMISSFLDDDYHKKTQLHFILQRASVMQDIADTEWNCMKSEAFYSGFLGQALMLYDLSNSSSSCDAVTPLTSMSNSNKPANFSGEFDSEKSEYHDASMLACYLENISTPWRTANHQKRMRAGDITRMLTGSRRRMFLDTKMAFRDDQVAENFASLSGQNIKQVMSEDSYASLPVCRGAVSEGYYSNIEKMSFDPRLNHFFPRFLKAKNKSSRHKPDRYSETVFTDWCSTKSAGMKVRDTFNKARKIPGGILAGLSIKYDLEIDEIKESFYGFDDVLDDYEFDDERDDSDD